jgi:tetratricopeptide (TPR) repeat protein
MRFRLLIVSAVVVATGGMAAGVAWQFAGARRLHTELAAARQEIEAGLVSLARQRLIALANKHPGDAEVLFDLGRCEAARGNGERALEIWGRVPARSAWATHAALAGAETAISLGRITDAERMLRSAVERPGPEIAALRRLLLVLLGQQGRLDEGSDVIKTQWRNPALLKQGDISSRLALLRQSVGLDFEPFPLEWNISQLDRAAESAREEDRIALALARTYLATRAGRFDQARVELDFCRKHRPDAPTIWKARLKWSTAVDDVEAAREAIEHLPAQALGPADVLDLRAWLARKRGDLSAERQALDELIQTDPGRSASYVRLAELLQHAGDRAGAASLRQQKADLDAARDRYNRLYREDRYASHVEELARLAEQLGRWFEAHGFWEIIQAREPGNAQAAVAVARLSTRDSQASHASLDEVRSIAAGTDRPSSRVLARPAERASRAPAPVPRFEDKAAASGLGAFVLDNGSSAIHQLPEAFCGGIALLDFDGDGWMDVYCVQGGSLLSVAQGSLSDVSPRPSGERVPEGRVRGPGSVPEGNPPSAVLRTSSSPGETGPVRGPVPTHHDLDQPHRGDTLFRNRGDGTFEDLTKASGIAAMPRGYGHGVSVADYNNDGHPDIFVTRFRSYALYQNRGDGTFEDVTEKAGLGGDRDWPTSSAFADFDNDGDLDLYVCHYARWDPGNPRICTDPSGTFKITCDPRSVESLPDHLFRNDSGRFVDITASAGIVDKDGRGLGVVAADFDGDGLVDVFVANDSTANFLFHNLGGMRFQEVGHVAGVAANAEGGYQAGMGVACGDLDGDGRPDLAVTNFYGESTSFFYNLGQGLFVDHTAAIGLLAPSRFFLGFGAVFFDANNDGHLDLITANGHISDLRPLFPCPMTAQLYLGREGGALTDVTSQAGPVFQERYVARGLAAGDLDNDGRLDAVMVAQNDPLVVFQNATEASGTHFITFRLEGTRSNRDGVGAAVAITAAGRRQVAWRLGGGSFQSAGDPRLHFGIGSNDRVESVEVRWPSGTVDRYQNLAADRGYHVREGQSSLRPLRAFRR